MAVDHFAAAAATLALLFHSFGCAAAACAGATEATSGSCFKWPQANPALVAPVTTRFHYDSYQSPLSAEYTGRVISVKAPVDFEGGFDLVSKDGKTLEQYSLNSIEVRKPGKVPEGSQQVVGHALEAVLLHKETGGTGHWAAVIVPFEADPNAQDDMLTALFGAAGTKLPSKTGVSEHVLLGGNAIPLDLNKVWQNRTFYEFWIELPVTCDGQADAEGKTVGARQFMLNASVGTTQTTLGALMNALEQSLAELPMQPSKLAWSVAGCPKSAAECAPLQAADLGPGLQNAKELQSKAVAKLRARKSDMDSILEDLGKNNTVEGLYQKAVAARDGLKGAQAELEAVMHTVAALMEQKDSAASAVFDSDKPAAAAAKKSAPEAAEAANATQAGNATELKVANETLFRQAQAAEAAGAGVGAGGATAGTAAARTSFLAVARRAAAEPQFERRRGGDHVNLIQVGARRFSSSAAGSLKEL